MQHSDPDVLALVALGEAPSAADAEHLRTCPQCRDEVAGLSRVAAGVRVDLAEAPPVAPPPRVWEAIAARTGVTAAARLERVAGAETPDAQTPGGQTPPARAPAPPRPLRLLQRDRAGDGGRRQDRSGGAGERNRLLLAVAASLLIGAAGGVLGTSLVERKAPPAAQSVQVLAQVDLANLKRTAATGHAVVVETPTGPRIRVDTAQLTPVAGGFYEVWLIDRQVKKMVGIGILHPGEDEFAVPNGVDLSRYPIVDVSVQQPGDPRHSGDSVLRGTIAT